MNWVLMNIINKKLKELWMNLNKTEINIFN